MRHPVLAVYAAAVMAAFCSCAPRTPTSGQLQAYGEGKVAYAAGRLAEAERSLEPSAKDASLPQARFLLGKTRFFLGRYDEAASVFKNLVSRFPKYREAEIWLARTFLQQGKIEEADKLAQELIAYDSSDPRLFYLEAMVRVSEGDFKAALGLFDRSSESGEELAKSCFESARLYFQFGQDDKAVERLKRAQAILPPNAAMRSAVDELLKRIGARGIK
jgi:tetratricopeptide (TPR) repeat protein